MANASPFPYDWLPRWSRREAAQASAIARALQPTRRSASSRSLLDARWSSLLGGRLEAWPGTPALHTRDALLARFGNESLAAVMHHGTLGTFGVIIDAPFALTLAARALGADEDAARRAGAARSFGPAQEGSLSMLCAQAATLLCAASPPPVIRGVTDRVIDVTAAIDATSLLAWTWRVSVGLDAGEATLVVDARTILAAGAPVPFAPDQLGAIEIPLALCIARDTLSAHDMAAIEPGDVLLTELASDALEGALEAGTCTLSLGDMNVPVEWRDGHVIVAGAAVPQSSGRNAMNDSNEPHESGAEGASERGAEVMRTERLATVPVDVELVIARATVPLATVGAWRVGEIVAFPTRIGEAVEVRAGGRTIARGELCDVDGQLGVRITELSS